MCLNIQCVCIYIYIPVHTYTYLYIYISIQYTYDPCFFDHFTSLSEVLASDDEVPAAQTASEQSLSERFCGSTRDGIWRGGWNQGETMGK